MKTPARVSVHEARHLLRALLRECTYLPDPASQTCIKKQVLARFRARAQKTGDAAKWLQKGRKSLHVLERANEGELTPLNKVMLLTYGRIGPRRRELLRPLLQPRGHPGDAFMLETEMKRVQLIDPAAWDITTVPVPAIFDIPKRVNEKNGNEVIEYEVSNSFPKLKALAKSQVKVDVPTPRRELKKDVFKMPVRNKWERDMPRCRVSNMVKDWRAAFLDRLLPPLPEQEWTRLQGLVHGTLRWEGCKQRRKRPPGKPDILKSTDLEKYVHINVALGEQLRLDKKIKVASLDVPPSKTDKIHYLAGDGSVRRYWQSTDRWLADPGSIAKAEEEILLDELRLIRPLNKKITKPGKRGHAITPRLMKRLWTKVFRMCPMITEQEGRKWQVTWGSAPTVLTQRVSNAAFTPLFQGLPVMLKGEKPMRSRSFR
jgi:hypothetical protein